jgi:hypothetical protein
MFSMARVYYPCTLKQSVCGSLRVLPIFKFVVGYIPVKKKSYYANRKIKTAWPYGELCRTAMHGHVARFTHDHMHDRLLKGSAS